MSASAENRAKFEARRAEIEKAATEALTQAQGRSVKMRSGVTVQVVRKIGEEGKLFGSVGINKDICDAPCTRPAMSHAKSEVHLDRGPIKSVGDHEVAVSLHPEVNLKIIVSVVGEK